MRNSLLARYIRVFAFTLITCTLLLGVSLMYFSAQNFSAEKQMVLKSAAERVLGEARQLAYPSGGRLETDPQLGGVLESVSDSTGAVVYITDADGNVALCSEGSECIHNGRVNSRIRNTAIKRGKYSSVGYLDAFFRNTGEYTYGVPLRIDGEIAGFVFASSPMSPLIAFLLDLLVTFLVSSGTMLAVSAVIIFFATKRLTNPLKEISDAANRFGAGDFDARVAFEGEDEIGMLAAAFNNMADSLSEFEHSRRSFVANVSHELRTPMTTIGGYIDGILDGTIPPEKQSHYLGIASEEVKRLSRLTTSLLSISRMEEGQVSLNIENFNAWDVVLSVMWSAEKRIVEKGIDVPDLNVDARFVNADRDMLHQVVYNLVDNAIKFTRDGGTISVAVETRGDNTVIRVKNSGDGIPPDEIPHIFGRFYKTDKSRGLDRTGTGLGLYIVKTLVGRMNGSVWAESEVGSYTEFFVSLPSGTAGKVKERRIRFKRQADARAAAKDEGSADGGTREKEKHALFIRISSPFRRRGRNSGNDKDGRGVV